MTTVPDSLPPQVRRKRILEELSHSNFLRVSDLSDLFGTSEVTIRSDLATLERTGSLHRVHGGAMLEAGPHLEPAFEQSLDSNRDQKRRIGTAAAAKVRNGETVLLDVGSTTSAVARALVERLDLTQLVTMTNGLKIALDLEAAIPRFTVMLTGGTLRPLQHSLVDPMADVLLNQINADTVFIGCNGIDVSAGVTNVNLPEADMKRRMMARSVRRIVVADGGKIGKVSVASMGAIADIDLLITDETADPSAVAALRDAGLTVEVAA